MQRYTNVSVSCDQDLVRELDKALQKAQISRSLFFQAAARSYVEGVLTIEKPQPRALVNQEASR